MSTIVLTKTIAKQILRLFDHCFKQGVMDAADSSDDLMAREWLEARLNDGKFGRVIEPDAEYNWKRWRFTLYWWSRESKIGTLGENYIDYIRDMNSFHYALLPVCMRFYLMGVQEWLDYPNPSKMVFFTGENNVHWAPVGSNIRKISVTDFISYVQMFIFERVEKQYEGDMPSSRYDSFAQALWTLTKRFPDFYGKFREDNEGS